MMGKQRTLRQIHTGNSVEQDLPCFRPYWFDMPPTIVRILSPRLHVPPEVADAPC